MTQFPDSTTQWAAASDSRRLPRWLISWPIVVLLLCIHYTLGITSVVRKSSSCDEIAYLTAGYTYWQTGDYRLVPEHPPVIELWSTIPLNFMNLKMPSFDQSSWRASNQWEFGWQFFYELGNPLQKMLMSGRAMIGLFSVALGLTIYLTSRRWFGPLGGLISLALFAFAPEMLAHGFQVTTDMAASLFFTLSLLSIWWALHRVSTASVLLSGLALAALFNSKLSAVLIFPAYFILIAIRCISRRPLELAVGRIIEIRPRLRRLAVHAAVFVLQGLIVAGGIWATHGFKYPAFVHSTPGVDRFLSTNPDTESRQSDWDYELNRAGWFAPTVKFARDHRLLPEAYLYGFLFARNMTQTSEAFLNGWRQSTGFRSYFPYAFLIKTTLPALGLFFLTLVAWTTLIKARGDETTAQDWRAAPVWYRAMPFIIFSVIYWITAIGSQFNIGHRHILPIYAPLMIFAGALATVRWRRVPIVAVVAVLVVLHAGVAAQAWPHYLSFFNSSIGGSRNGYRHLVDSSVDWGQDMMGLADWLKANNPPDSPHAQPVYLSYLGNCSPGYYGIKPRYLPSNSWWQKEEHSAFEPGIYCISATMIQQVFLLPLSRWSPHLEALYQLSRPRIDRMQQYQPFPTTLPGEDPEDRLPEQVVRNLRFGRLCAFLREREPDDEVGHSILIYRVSATDIHRALYGPPPPMVAETARDFADMADKFAMAGLTRIPEQYYREALKLTPDDDRCHNNLGIMLSRRGKSAEAAAEFQEAIRLYPKYAEAHNNLAAMYVKLGRMDDAIHHHEQAIRFRKNWPEAHTNLAGLYAGKGDLPDAIIHYREALRLHPHWPAMHNNLGIALARAGRFDEAVASFHEALRQDPDTTAVHVNLGNALRQLGRADEARHAYREALRINPEDKAAARRLAEMTTSRPATTGPDVAAPPREQ
ncbi:MAG TPA: tetratricopeptide repeat protein [Phycisphaerae bacterium]|nr:tetratricopeptide repeat protein [Phycisphaerae bacterium]